MSAPGMTAARVAGGGVAAARAIARRRTPRMVTARAARAMAWAMPGAPAGARRTTARYTRLASAGRLLAGTGFGPGEAGARVGGRGRGRVGAPGRIAVRRAFDVHPKPEHGGTGAERDDDERGSPSTRSSHGRERTVRTA
jgi:hypothetical protein